MKLKFLSQRLKRKRSAISFQQEATDLVITEVSREDAKARSYVAERPDLALPSDLFSKSFKPVFSAIFASSRLRVSLFKSSDFHHEAEKPQDLHELFLNLVENLHF